MGCSSPQAGASRLSGDSSCRWHWRVSSVLHKLWTEARPLQRVRVAKSQRLEVRKAAKQYAY
jgi:hypothetical protein